MAGLTGTYVEMCKEPAATFFLLLPQHLLEGLKKTTENLM
jgi:hypothetical protein